MRQVFKNNEIFNIDQYGWNEYLNWNVFDFTYWLVVHRGDTDLVKWHLERRRGPLLAWPVGSWPGLPVPKPVTMHGRAGCALFFLVIQYYRISRNHSKLPKRRHSQQLLFVYIGSSLQNLYWHISGLFAVGVGKHRKSCWPKMQLKIRPIYQEVWVCMFWECILMCVLNTVEWMDLQNSLLTPIATVYRLLDVQHSVVMWCLQNDRIASYMYIETLPRWQSQCKRTVCA